MKKGKYAKRRGAASRVLVMLLAIVMIVGISVGGTLAWLTDKSDEVKNVFTDSDIGVTLEESKGTPNDDGEKEFKMVPGWTIVKDPKATVTTGSEACYLFITVEENGVSFTPEGATEAKQYAFSDFLSYEIATGWTKLEDGVYYKVIDEASEMGIDYSILKDDQVKVKDTVTKQMMNDLETYGVNPTLTFKAYAVQYYEDNTTPFEPAEAWANRPTP